MSRSFDEIVIIYNPNSTGDGKKNAEDLAAALEQAKVSATLSLRETTHAGHAEEMAIEYARSDKQLLLISSSGDGGYHELINGVLDSNAINITVGVLPSGNANDHYTALSSDDGTIVDSIVSGNVRSIDVLRVESRSGGKPWTRYAHSYAGIGLSPTIGQELTKATLNVVNEKLLLLKYLFQYTHATIRVAGKKKRYSSLVFSNIDQMSKVIKLAKSGSIDDGKFEMNAISYRSKLLIIWLLIKSATFGLEEKGSYSEYSFETVKRLLIQLDGEVYTLDGKSSVRIECMPQRLKTIL